MPDRRNTGAGYPGIGYGQGYGRDFGGGGLNQGFDGSWGRGYGGSLGASDYRRGFGGEAYAGGTSGADYARSLGGRAEGEGGDDRTWMDSRAEENRPLAGPYRGKGPRGWSTPDSSLYETVAERFTEDPLLDARQIEMTVEDGVVTLDGYVTSPSSVRLAEMLSRECAGVREVRNNLKVAPPRP